MSKENRKQEKRRRFKRLASHRTEEVLRRLDILGNCANRSNYDYTEKEVRKIFSAIDEKVKDVKSMFRYSRKKNNDKFRL